MTVFRGASAASVVRVILLACAVAALGAKLLLKPAGGARHIYEEAAMAVDERPARSVLFLGNSRIYVNDLPEAVRHVADSAHSPVRYDIHMRAWGAATLKQHWEDEGDRRLLAEPWDQVILQTESGTFTSAGSESDFRSYGAKLAQAAKADGAKVAVLANWTLGPKYFIGAKLTGGDAGAAEASQAYGRHGVEATRDFGRQVGAGVIDLHGAFAEAERLLPQTPLTTDGNHPSAAGTYLAALTIYGWLSHSAPAKAEWRPSSLDEATATKLKEIAGRHSG